MNLNYTDIVTISLCRLLSLTVNIPQYCCLLSTNTSTILTPASEEVGQAISELSRELSTNQIALFSHRVLK